MMKPSECRAKNYETCRVHGKVGYEQKEKFMKSFVSSNVKNFTHLTNEDELYLMGQLNDIATYSSNYSHSYADEPAPATREGELEYLQGYDPTKYGVDPDSVSNTADNIILTKGDDGKLKILLIERGNFPYKGYWCHPGGFIDEGESTKDAAIRELKEETSMDVSSDMIQFVKKYSHDWRDPRMKHVFMNTHVTFLPSIPKFEAADDAADAKLVDLKSLFDGNDSIQLGFDHKKSIADSVAFLLE